MTIERDVNSTRWVKVNKYCELTGETPDTVYWKKRRHFWKENQHYRKAPDGRLWINLDEVEKWIQSERYQCQGA